MDKVFVVKFDWSTPDAEKWSSLFIATTATLTANSKRLYVTKEIPK